GRLRAQGKEPFKQGSARKRQSALCPKGLAFPAAEFGKGSPLSDKAFRAARQKQDHDNGNAVGRQRVAPCDGLRNWCSGLGSLEPSFSWPSASGRGTRFWAASGSCWARFAPAP